MSPRDPTSLGGSEGSFPATRWSLLRSSADSESPTHRDALETLARIYWRPVYAYLRAKWGKSNEEAKDLTQDFFETFYGKGVASRVSPEGGRFRAYVMVALDNLVRVQWRNEHREKRGGSAFRIQFEGFDVASGPSPETIFFREWTRSIVDQAIEDLETEYRSRGKESHFALFRLHDLERPPGEDVRYEALAVRYHVGESDVKNILYAGRIALRRKVLAIVADTAESPDEAEREFRELFAGESP